MGYIYTISSKYNLCYVKFTGEVNGKEVIRLKRKIFSDPKWKFGMNQINDYLKVKRLVVEREDIDIIVEVEKEQDTIVKDNKRKLAIVSDNDLYQAIFKYYEVIAKKLLYKTKVFRNIEQALKWVGLDAYPYSLMHPR